MAFALQLRKENGKPSVRVVEKCPGIPVAAAQYTVYMYEKYRRTENLVFSQWLSINLMVPEFDIKILAHAVCKMRIIREPKKVAL
jgi:hypothetical protein